MKRLSIIITICIVAVVSCDDFLTLAPIDSPSEAIFWKSSVDAEMYVNNLYRGLEGLDRGADLFESYSDNAVGRASSPRNNIAKGTHETNDSNVQRHWDYSEIRHALGFIENIDQVPDISQSKLDELEGQVRFFLAWHYHNLITLYRDVPLLTEPLSLEESDVGKSPKEDVLEYILEHLNMAIEKLPITWPDSEIGRVTKGAALTLKARVLLYNERWDKAAEAAQEVMELGIYELHPNYDELFRAAFNNTTNEVILARQYVENIDDHEHNKVTAPVVGFRGQALYLPTPALHESFWMEDGLLQDESPLYDPANPFENRDPRYYDTILYHGSELNGTVVDVGADHRRSLTYIYFKKYIQDFKDGFRPGFVNFKIFRYADVLLMYAEAKNEVSGPESSIYEALDLIRERVGMPLVDRGRYRDQASLRELIRNERRVELANEGLRYFDIIRWRIAEETMNMTLMSLDPSEWDNPPLVNGEPVSQRTVEERVFLPAKHYVLPIPQDAIDRASKLEQHSEW